MGFFGCSFAKILIEIKLGYAFGKHLEKYSPPNVVELLRIGSEEVRGNGKEYDPNDLIA
ncbi:hypothetical protein [Gimesia aquarii]|uniref:Uncharacterized protein n=1 Tax=Gimesia aquarii TaxID=2527964 RepID=A0A517WZT9_9PLAN|nr:hypothetical protein [Gimesia aquarii]QDU10768.1 hypothetical protein V202x_41800 [Gimesia aquarii]